MRASVDGEIETVKALLLSGAGVKPAERPKYIEAFFTNIAWNVCDERLVNLVEERFNLF